MHLLAVFYAFLFHGASWVVLESSVGKNVHSEAADVGSATYVTYIYIYIYIGLSPSESFFN